MSEPARRAPMSQWIGAIVRYRSDHPATRKILDTIDRLLERPYPTHVLIHGEPGTGKEGLARALHAAMHPSPDAPFVKVASGGRDRAELLRDLFGSGGGDREAGAFVAGEGGTVYLDDVGRIDSEVQARLAPALRGRYRREGETRSRPCKVSVIASTDVPLIERLRTGQIRDDLYYRLARIELHVPSLRERPTDIVPATIWTANHVLELHGRNERLALEGDSDPGDIILSNDAADLLRLHPWPGNFRELDVVIERVLMLYHRTGPITPDHIRQALSSGDGPA